MVATSLGELRVDVGGSPYLPTSRATTRPKRRTLPTDARDSTAWTAGSTPRDESWNTKRTLRFRASLSEHDAQLSLTVGESVGTPAATISQKTHPCHRTHGELWVVKESPPPHTLGQTPVPATANVALAS